MISMILNLNYGFLYYMLRQISVNQRKDFELSNLFITLTDNYESLDV